MSLQLQQFQHDQSEYDRPEQAWVCGKTARGEACRIGPDHRGRCRATAECLPKKQGDRWSCTRSPVAGGRCPDGPRPDGTCACPITPCQPLRSQRAVRNLLVTGAIALTVGLLLLLGGGPFRQQFLSPGALSMNHAELDSDCASCHTAGGTTLGAVLAAAVNPPTAHAESANCLDCHNFGDAPLSPHSLPRVTLAAPTEATATHPPADPGLRTSLVRSMSSGFAESDDLACSTCHVEHRGRHVDLKRMDRFRCQSCHERPFRSFPDGHAEFTTAYPTKRRTRIAFNHASHIGGHFESEGWSGTCTTCHVPDPTSAYMLVRGFDATCGSCHHHRDALRGAILPEPAVSVFSLPSVDLDTLRARGIWTGDDPWPSDASIGDEVPLSPFVAMILATDRAITSDLGHFDDADRLLDLSGESDEVAAAAGRIVWAVKSLLYELTDGGPRALPDRLAAALGPIEPTEIDALVGQPADAALAPHETWQANLASLRERFLPNLARDVERYRTNPDLLLQPPSPGPEPERVAPAPTTNEQAVPDADEELLVEEDLLGGDDEDLLGGGEDDLLGGDDEDQLGGGEDDLVGGDEDDLLGGGEDDLLGGDEDDLLGGDEDDLLGGDEDDLLGGDEDDLLGGDEDDLLGGDEGDLPGGAETETSPERAPSIDELQAELDALRDGLRESSGWILDPDRYTVAYRPSGHANQFMRAWLDRTARAGDGPVATVARRLFDALRADKAPGWCVRCHSVDQIADELGYEVNWMADRPHLGARSFTRFDHGPHFNFVRFRNCVSCHSIDGIDRDAIDTWKTSYADGATDAASFAPSFGPILKSTCVECHTPQGAGDGCLTCHQYHVGTFRPLLAPPEFGSSVMISDP